MKESKDLTEYKAKVKRFINRRFPEQPIRCWAQAMRYGAGQKEREEILKELDL